MSFFDTIEIATSVKNGPRSGEYQTKDLDNCMHTYMLHNNRLFKRLIKYTVVPMEQRKHPLFGSLIPTFIGLADTDYHGYITMYSADSTWKIKFTDGELVGSELIEFFANDPDREDSLQDYEVDCENQDDDNETYEFNYNNWEYNNE